MRARLAVASTLALLLVACGSRVDRAHFARIESGVMTPTRLTSALYAPWKTAGISRQQCGLARLRSSGYVSSAACGG
jgi:hypothetical protein